MVHQYSTFSLSKSKQRILFSAMNSCPLTDEELELSLILAQASKFTYDDELSFANIQKTTGISNVQTFNLNDENQHCISGFSGVYDRFLVVAFKGTDCYKDWIKNSRFSINKTDFGGEVHYGFAQAVLNNWDQLLEVITKSNISQEKSILLTGHSLGGALAILTAFKLNSLPEFSSRIEAVYSYGAPRVGDHNFNLQYRPTHHRFEYNQDPIPSLPSIGYKHTGKRYYLPKDQPIIRTDAQGSEAYQTHIKIASLIAKIFVKNNNFNLISDSIEHVRGVVEDVSDHNIEKYINHIQNYIQFRKIVKGLELGDLKRHGSAIKDVKTGNIICSLLEQTPQGRDELVIQEGTRWFINGVEKQVPLQLSSIATGTSVLNLAINIAGFAYMGKKLKQIENVLNDVRNHQEEKFNLIEEHLHLIHLNIEDVKQQIMIFDKQ
ncbi:MAG: lipase family protein, partial [Calothrix sp. SM1_7_51]|nr:lipase family protein [Calothrix sp. SM1_7_51]